MAEHHVGFGGDGVRLALHHFAKQLLCSCFVILRIFLGALRHLVEAVVCRIICKHVADEAFLNGLFHRIEMERSEAAVRQSLAEAFEGFALGRGSESEIRGIGTHLSLLNEAVDKLVDVSAVLVFVAAERGV